MAVVAIPSASSKIKLFQLTQKYYHDVGIFSSQQQPNHYFNWKTVLIQCVCVPAFIGMSSYFFVEANSMKELAITFYASTGTLTAMCINLINIFQRDHLFQTIENFDDFIEKRKFVIIFYFK